MGLCALAASAQAPSFIPIWTGREPVRYCIDPALEPLRPEILYGFWTWAGQTGLPYEETRDCSAPRTIAYRLGATGRYYGLAMFPPAGWPEQPDLAGRCAAGDIWLNQEIAWAAHPGARELALAVLTHESGHAFGMGDSDEPEGVMNPIIQPGRIALSARERRAIRCLYRGECQ